MNLNLKSLTFLILYFLINSPLFSQSYITNGTAVQTECNCYRLTSASGYQGGSVWNSQQINLNQSFDYGFKVYLGCNDGGADGIVFGLQPNGTSIGSAGGGLGMQGVSPSLGVYIDTYQNGGDSDPWQDHISINKNGNLNHSNGNNLAGPLNLSNIEDCQWHDLRVTWNASSQNMKVFLDGSQVLNYSGNVVNSIFGGNPNVYWGFTGSTGGAVNVQQFCTSLSPSASVSFYSVCTGEPIQFTGEAAAFYGNINWNWSMGDGTTYNSQNPSHTFDTPGVYDVTLSATDAINCPESVTLQIQVEELEISPLAELFTCDKAVLPPISGINLSGNQAFYTNSTGSGTPYYSGDEIVLTQDLTLYAFDSNTGCSNSQPLVLNYAPTIENTLNVDLCPGEIHEEGDSSYSETGVYENIYQTSAGCDSIVITNLVVHGDYEFSKSPIICAGESFLEGSETYSSNGNHSVMYESEFGCDSLIQIDLIILDDLLNERTVELCNGEIYQEGESVYTETGVYQDSYASSSGCDSIVITDISFYENYYSEFDISLCLGESHLEGSSVYDETGTYEELYQTINGCDSIVKTTIEILESSQMIVNESICDGNHYLEGSSNYTETGTYHDTYTNVFGCDSTIITMLDVFPVYETHFDTDICEGDTFQFHQSELSQAGTYDKVLMNQFGCDSTIYIHLDILPNPEPELIITEVNSCTPCTVETSFINTNTGDDLSINFGADGLFSSDIDSHVFDQADLYEITAQVTDIHGCTGTDVSWFECVATPEITIDSDKKNGCEPTEIKFYPIIETGTIEIFTWELNNGFLFSESEPSFLYEQHGLYDITLEAIDINGCVAVVNEPEYINIYDLPEADFTIEFDDQLSTGNPIELLDHSVGDVVDWEWTFDGNVPVETLFGSNPEVIIPTESDGNYWVSQRVTTVHGCTDSITTNLNLKPIENIYIPNSFTPNGDGYNEYLTPVLFNYQSENYEFIVFNRWGQVVFRTEDSTLGWNGSINNGGSYTPDGVYNYVIKATSYSGKREMIYGHITMLR